MKMPKKTQQRWFYWQTSAIDFERHTILDYHVKVYLEFAPKWQILNLFANTEQQVL